nr:hypothetical protein [Tanacetum cinerariifolium]
QFLHHSSANSWKWDLHSSGSGNTLHCSGNLYCQWELSPGSGNALCILFPTLVGFVLKLNREMTCLSINKLVWSTLN